MGLVCFVRVGKVFRVMVVVLKLWWFFLFGIHVEVVEFFLQLLAKNSTILCLEGCLIV